MYPYNTPGAFVPHSAINLSVKAANDAAAAGAQTGIPPLTSLDLTMSDSPGGTGVTSSTNNGVSSLVGSAGGTNNSSGSYLTGDTSSYGMGGGHTGGTNNGSTGGLGSGLTGSNLGSSLGGMASTCGLGGKTGASQILDLTRPVLG